MKTAIKIILGICIVVLSYLCIAGVMVPVKFEKQKAMREKEVIARLVAIRKAEVAYKNQFGYYTASFDTLINFIKEDKSKAVKKEGTFTAEQMAIIPCSNGEYFQLATAKYTTASGIKIDLFEAKAPYKSYLNDLNRQELINLIDTQKQLNRYPGLQVGSVTMPNNNAGNWE